MNAEPEPAAPDIAGRAPAVIALPDGRQPTKKVTSGSERRRRLHVKRCRYDDAELAEFEARASARGLTEGAYMRAATIGEPGPRARRRASVDVAALTAALGAFHRQGGNYNQAVRAANTLALVAQERSSDRLADEVRELRRMLDDIQQQFPVAVAAIMAALNRDREG